MAEKLIHLPEEMKPIIEAIAIEKAKVCEPNSARAITIEALKLLHKKVCK